jgi:hypothetical protein
VAGELRRADSPVDQRASGALLLAAWLVLCALALGVAARDLSAPGLYYDEVIQADPVREFLDPDGKPLQIPGARSTRVFGRWLPLFTQPYMGALKSQLLIPSFAAFGASAASLRLTTLAWSLVALGFAMLFARRLLGLPAALVTGALLAADPSFLFVSRHDWGSFALALLCRCAGLWAFLTGFRAGSPARLFGAGLCFGLGIYNKIDFAAPLAAIALALAAVAPRSVASAIRSRPRLLLAAAAGFALGAAPMLLELGSALLLTRDMLATSSEPEVWREKLGALRSMLDGSYFDRLMRAGGQFGRMFDVEGAAASPFLVIYAGSLAFVGVRLILRARRGDWDPVPAFVLASALLASLALLATPRTIRIHHALGAYPFPQLVVALALVELARPPRRLALRAAAALVVTLAFGGSLLTSLRTYDTIERTRGKGRWTDATSDFARELAAQPGSVAVSLDWGFHAQLHFLDRGLDLREPIWALVRQGVGANPWAFVGDGRVRYLLWDQDFGVFPLGRAFLAAARATGSDRIEIRRHLDRDGDPAFVSVRIAGPHRIVYRGPGAARPFEVTLL